MGIPYKGKSLNKGNPLIKEILYKGKSFKRARMKGDLVYVLVITIIIFVINIAISITISIATYSYSY